MFDLLPVKRRGKLQHPFSEMEEMIKKMWFDFPFHDLEWDGGVNWSPRLDISENDKTIEVVADLPGMDKENINISLDGDLLIIKGEKKEEKEKKDKHYHTIERHKGSFYRSLRLPVDVENDKIEASFKKGVLTLTLPKSKKSKKAAQITIK